MLSMHLTTELPSQAHVPFPNRWFVFRNLWVVLTVKLLQEIPWIYHLKPIMTCLHTCRFEIFFILLISSNSNFTISFSVWFLPQPFSRMGPCHLISAYLCFSLPMTISFKIMSELLSLAHRAIYVLAAYSRAMRNHGIFVLVWCSQPHLKVCAALPPTFSRQPTYDMWWHCQFWAVY